MCYHFDDIIKTDNLDPDNILIDEKSHKNILVNNISYKIIIDSKPLSETYNSSYNRNRYLTRVKSGITYIISHNYVKMQVDSFIQLFMML